MLYFWMKRAVKTGHVYTNCTCLEIDAHLGRFLTILSAF